ncbi:uncharacterized protein LOC114361953 [Ostrinia furnacalis]|uniref:uncharacterized protein LOC114361953 n=1 Tax=Ostrinia furnacalis TaxID=93504 RepID=UPI00103BDCD1|nr:uncharacterized protein LOC114361953 [Ostrinia furnacalis]
MRATAAIVILAAFSLRSCAHATDPSRHRDVTDGVRRLIKCARTLGPSTCIAALANWRAENAINTKEKNPTFSLKEIQKFPWEQYTNSTEDELYSRLCSGTEKLLQYKALNFNMVPGYEFQLASRGNGTLNIDVYKSTENETSRGMKKMRKKFYAIIPYLLLPGLIMSAVLPFVLPALKMMTVAVGMLNNMALSGAIFTLLRNNAFNDKYDKKVIYVNEGYSNEKAATIQDNKPEVKIRYEPGQIEIIPGPIGPHEYEVVEDWPTNNEWINQLYANKFTKAAKKDLWREGARTEVRV